MNKKLKTQMTEKIYHLPSQVSERLCEDWRCKMAGMAMHLSLRCALVCPYKNTMQSFCV